MASVRSLRGIDTPNSGVRHLKELEEAGLPAPAVNQIEVRARRYILVLE